MKLQAANRLRASLLIDIAKDPNTPTDGGQTFDDLLTDDPVALTQDALNNDGSVDDDNEQELLNDDLPVE